MMLQYLVLVRNACFGIEHLKIMAVTKYEFQNTAKKLSSAYIISTTIRPKLS